MLALGAWPSAHLLLNPGRDRKGEIPFFAAAIEKLRNVSASGVGYSGILLSVRARGSDAAMVRKARNSLGFAAAWRNGVSNLSTIRATLVKMGQNLSEP